MAKLRNGIAREGRTDVDYSYRILCNFMTGKLCYWAVQHFPLNKNPINIKNKYKKASSSQSLQFTFKQALYQVPARGV